jgi:hypothetical protein
VANCTAFNLPVRGDKNERPQVERLAILGFDCNDLGVLKRVPKALSIENNDWVDLVHVRGYSEAWYDGDGDVVVFYGN